MLKVIAAIVLFLLGSFWVAILVGLGVFSALRVFIKNLHTGADDENSVDG